MFVFLLYPPRIAFANCGHKLCKLCLIRNKLVVVVVVVVVGAPTLKSCKLCFCLRDFEYCRLVSLVFNKYHIT